jgi:hypothetical protein
VSHSLEKTLLFLGAPRLLPNECEREWLPAEVDGRLERWPPFRALMMPSLSALLMEGRDPAVGVLGLLLFVDLVRGFLPQLAHLEVHRWVRMTRLRVDTEDRLLYPPTDHACLRNRRVNGA